MRARSGLMVLGFAVLAVAIIILGSDSHTYMVRAELADAGGLRKNSSVKIAGVPAGKVKDLVVTKDDHAIATLEINDSAGKIGEGARVNIRPTDLLGERYAEIKGGDASRPMPSGALIPLSRTAEPVELDDILNTLDPNTRQGLSLLINETGVALAGRGANFNKLLAQLPPSLQDTTKLIAQVRAQDAAMKIGIKRADSVTALVNSRHTDMAALIKQASRALDVVAQKRAALGQTIQNAPGALASLRSTLTNLDRASTQLRPTAVSLQQTTGPLKDTLAAIPAFTKQATPTLDKARAVSPDITRLAVGATPTVKLLRPTANDLNGRLQESVPILHQLNRRGFDDILFFINNFNRGVQARDGIGHFIGAHLDISTEYIDQAIQQFTVKGNGTPVTPTPVKRQAATKTPNAAPSAAAPAAKTPAQGLKDLLKPVLPQVKALGDKIGKAVGGVVGGITGKLQQVVPGLVGGKRQAPAPAPTPPAAGKGSDALRLFDYLMGQ